MLGVATALVVSLAMAIVLGLVLWGAHHGTLRVWDQDRVDRTFWAMVADLEGDNV